MFSVAEAGLFSSAQPKSLEPWTSFTGLVGRAHEISLHEFDPRHVSETASARRDELVALLSVRPMSPQYWLALSEMRTATGARAKEISEAFRLSVLTGPNQR